MQNGRLPSINIAPAGVKATSQPTAGQEALDGRVEGAGQLGQFAVHLDADDVESGRDQIPGSVEAVPELVPISAADHLLAVADHADQASAEVVNGNGNRAGSGDRKEIVLDGHDVVDFVPVGRKGIGRDSELVEELAPGEDLRAQNGRPGLLVLVSLAPVSHLPISA